MEQKFLNDSTNTKIPVYTKNWFVILMLIVFFPVGLWLMWAYKKNWNMIVKLLITAFFAYCFIVSIASDSKPNNSIDTDMSSQSSCADNIVTDNQLNEDLSKTTTLSAITESDVTTCTSSTVTTTVTTTTEPLEIKSPDEFIYNDKLYSINNLTMDEVKNTFSGLTEMDETIVKNDDIGFVCDNSGNINVVFLFNDSGSFLKI